MKGKRKGLKKRLTLSDKIESLEKNIQSLQMLLRDITEKFKIELRCPECRSMKI